MSKEHLRHDLCARSELEDPGTRGFEVDCGAQQTVALFVVLKDGVLSAYRNRCPHTGAPLNWLPDQFLDLENSFIECAIHGALFRPEDGYCLRGPCAGGSLDSIDLQLVEDRVQVTLPVPDQDLQRSRGD